VRVNATKDVVLRQRSPRWFDAITARLESLPRDQKRALMIATDLVAIPAALWSALTLKLGTIDHGLGGGAWLYIAALVAAIPVFMRLGLYRAIVRFIGPRAMVTVLVGVTASVVLLTAANVALMRKPIPSEAFVIYWALAVIYVASTRFIVRQMFHTRRGGVEQVIIYGAGSTGAQLALALRSGHRYDPVAFVDDNEALHGSLVGGLEVFPPARIPVMRKQEDVSVVLLAMPSASRRRRREILEALESTGLHVQSVPEVSELLTGGARIEEVREIDAKDLLGREPVPPNPALFDACVRGKSVLVTGAGGSIGSELCRQIVELGPKRLIMLEMSELALYNIERELLALIRQEKLSVELVGLLGNAHHKARVREILLAYGVQTVYHAAAYKHVPIVEQNMIEGMHNNVFATWYTAEAALECRVEAFVLISTDKAVNPTNVMGATKRMAEIVLQGLQQRSLGTRFSMVRFGNVLESSGSVVPLFREQIRRGGPVTVTHPDVTRYFMTIPEASQLVIQAGSMAKGGDVFVLDMGKPIRIADLARRMVQLAGLTVRDDAHPDGDIEILFTGLRPAEKLFEELLIGKNVTGTDHPRILRAIEHSLPWEDVRALLDELLGAMDRFDCATAREVLMRGVREYAPVEKIQDSVWLRAGAGGKVLSLRQPAGRA